jgi:hypothetical protein
VKVAKPVIPEHITLPSVLVVSALEPEQEAVPVMARFVVVAKLSSVFPERVDDASMFAKVEFRAPLTVVEPSTAKEVVVALVRSVLPVRVEEAMTAERVALS